MQSRLPTTHLMKCPPVCQVGQTQTQTQSLTFTDVTAVIYHAEADFLLLQCITVCPWQHLTETASTAAEFSSNRSPPLPAQRARRAEEWSGLLAELQYRVTARWFQVSDTPARIKQGNLHCCLHSIRHDKDKKHLLIIDFGCQSKSLTAMALEVH